MKQIVFIISLIFTAHTFAQETNDPDIKDSSDIKFNSLDEILFRLDEFEFYTNLTAPKKAALLNSETSKLRLITSINFSQRNFFNTTEDITPGYLHSSLYDQYMENSKFNPIRTALGMIQAGAAGYLAYRHIKKYVIKK